MWARDFEIALGFWLALSWLIFFYPENSLLVAGNDYVCALLICLFSMLSYLNPMRHLHLLNLAVGSWLIGVAFWLHDREAVQQNYVVVGILLLMLAIIPSPSQRPPYQWEAFAKEKRQKKS